MIFNKIIDVFRRSEQLKETSLGGYFFALIYLVLPLLILINISMWFDFKMFLTLLVAALSVLVSFQMIIRKNANKHRF